MVEYAKLSAIDTLLCADSVEVFNDDVIYCCYELNKETGVKTGSVNLIHVNDDTGAVIPVQSVETRAIFDCKWNPFLETNSFGSYRKVFATANFTQCIQIWNIDENSSLKELLSCKIGEDESQSCLSLHWMENNRIITSTSDGKLFFFDLNIASREVASPISSWDAHSLYGSPIETWIVSGSRVNPNVVWSGGDDSELKGWDLRSFSSPIFVNKTAHSAGICSMHWHPNKPNVVAIGSYDEHVTKWDDRNTRKPITSKKIASSGIWRLKWHPSIDFSNLLLAACMYDGCKVVSFDDTENSITPIIDYQEHKSIAYGIDWYFPSLATSWVVSCSFYDHSLQVWNPTLK